MNHRLRSVIVCVVSLAVPVLFAANGPAPVTVQGVVEVINDVLRRPFVKTETIEISGSGLNSAFIDVPDGKRLVIEMVSIEFSHATEGNVKAYISTRVEEAQNWIRSPITFTNTRPISSTRSVSTGTHPITIRVDYVTGRDNEVFLQFESQSAGVGTFSCRGYLVDIP